MIQKIGKYRIVDTVGRGGMGTVFKAHDPVLDRTVAVKVLSTESAVTDEVRARFFREAQACARLSHPNIITVYDLADVEGRLFIVMEFLEGEELKQIIAARKPLPLEAKLSLMTQVCDGLAYAHQRGVIHRDVKPGNIFVVRDGGVKILDFGIARIMTADAGLTRTGLIMGTLRYMAPEQAQGRADYRSDIFALGAVFYEFLAYRPAFPGDDVLQLLEALRTHEPPRLDEVPPGLPRELADLIARAMHKDPARRPDLGDMRRQLDAIRRELMDEADRLRVDLRGRLDEARRLAASVAERVGGPAQDPTMPAIDHADVMSLKAAAQQIAGKIERLRFVMDQAGSWQPAVERGLALFRDGQFEAAIRELEAVVHELPEHARAGAILHEARVRLLDEARSALGRGSITEGLDRLEALSETHPSADVAMQADALRQAAETARAARSAAPTNSEFDAAATRTILRVDRAPTARPRFRRHAVAATTVIALATGAILYFGLRPSPAPVAPPRVETVAPPRVETRDAGEARRALENLKARVLAARKTAEQAGAPRTAASSFGAAADVERRGETAVAQQDFAEAASRYSEALGLYATATSETQNAVTESRRLQAQAEQARRAAESADAPRFAAVAWERARQADRAGERLLQDGQHAAAQQEFQRAQRGYRDAESAAGESAASQRSAADQQRLAAIQRQQAEAEQLRERAVTSRRAAEQAGADRHAAPLMTTGRAKERDAQTALTRQEYQKANDLLRAAAADFQSAAQSAAEAEQRHTAQTEVEKLRSDVAARRERAAKSEAELLAKELFDAAHAREKDGERLLAAQNVPGARQSYQDAATRYDDATRRAVSLRETMGQADRERARMETEKQRAHRESPSFAEALRQEQTGDTLYQRHAFKEAADSFRSAAGLFAKATPPATEPAPGFGRLGSDPSTDIREVLELLKRAYKAKDVAAVQRVRPGLRPQELQSLRDTFDTASSYALDLRVETIEIRGNDAQARAFREDIMVAKDGQIYRNEARVVVRLKRLQNRWVIEDIK